MFCPPCRSLIVGRIQWGGREEMKKNHNPHFPLFEYSLWSSCSVFMNFMALGKMLKFRFSGLVKQQLYHDRLQEHGLTFAMQSKIKHLMLTHNSLCKYLIKVCCWGLYFLLKLRNFISRTIVPANFVEPGEDTTGCSGLWINLIVDQNLHFLNHIYYTGKTKFKESDPAHEIAVTHFKVSL